MKPRFRVKRIGDRLKDLPKAERNIYLVLFDALTVDNDQGLYICKQVKNSDPTANA